MLQIEVDIQVQVEVEVDVQPIEENVVDVEVEVEVENTVVKIGLGIQGMKFLRQDLLLPPSGRIETVEAARVPSFQCLSLFFSFFSLSHYLFQVNRERISITQHSYL